MNQTQMNAAKNEMIGWLSHPAELGKAPAKIECAGEFELYDMHYYIFKYKKGMLGKWLLGVCGGFEGEDLEHCGHTFSEMQEYHEASAKEDAIALVEHVRNFIMEQAKEAEERKQNPGTFTNFVLMKDTTWDKERFIKLLEEDWGIVDEASDEDKAVVEDKPDTHIFTYKGAMVVVSVMPAPVPNGEAEYYAQSNYRWREAVDTVKQHTANLLVSVLGKELPVKEAGELLVKTVATCCKMDGVLGVYANETVYQPEFYLRCSQMIKDGLFPMMNLVWFAVYGGQKGGICAYTCGMSDLGFDEIEILESKASMGEIVDFLLNICGYIVTEDVILRDGETIGFSEEQKLPITRSQGVAVKGESLKIGF